MKNSKMILGVVFAILALAACSKPSGSAEVSTPSPTANKSISTPAPNPTSATDENQPRDVCKILTKEIAESVIGRPVKPKEEDTSAHCVYLTDDGDGLGLFFVGVGTKETFGQALKDSEALPNVKTAKADGFGDGAFWSGEQLVVMKNGNLMVFAGFVQNDSKPLVTDMATKVLAKM